LLLALASEEPLIVDSHGNQENDSRRNANDVVPAYGTAGLRSHTFCYSRFQCLAPRPTNARDQLLFKLDGFLTPFTHAQVRFKPLSLAYLKPIQNVAFEQICFARPMKVRFR
jgi:hypothetical protein